MGDRSFRLSLPKKDLFAVALPDIEYHSQVSFTFRKENYISNLQESPTQLAICFAPGSAYRTVTWGEPINHTFTSLGEKEISIRISLNNGKNLESHTYIHVIGQPIQYANKKDTEISIAATAKHSGGKIQIKYATFNTEKKQLIRPLIIADESDIYKFIEDKEINLEYLLNNFSEIEDINKVYDIVYIDNNKGFDDIFRNAQLFQDAMERINNMKGSIHDKNYVIGLGMGGLVASYALRDMENQGKNHDVYKFFTINTPHKGFNMPIGLQALIRHIHDIKIAKFFIKDISEEAKNLCNLLDQTAMKQMLIYSIDKNFNYQNNHPVFMQKYEGMGMPLTCKTVAISNGSYWGKNLFQPGERFFEFHKKKGTKSFFWKLVLLGNTEIKLDFEVNTLKSKQADQIYYGNLYLHKRLIFKYVDADFNKKVLNSTSDMVALDGAPGSEISIKQFFNEEDDILNAFKLNDFCFVPTVSALKMSNWQQKLLSGLNLNSGESGFMKLYATGENNIYIDLQKCADFLQEELEPQIKIGINDQIEKETKLTLSNVPSFIPIIWSFSNGNFKVISNRGNEVTVFPTKYQQSSTLIASVYLKEIQKVAELSLSSEKLKLSGDEYVLGVPKRYEINYLPYNAKLTWNYASGTKVIEQKDNYIDITAIDVSDPFIEAKVTCYDGTTTSARINLRNQTLESGYLICRSYWQETIDGGYRRKYALQMKCQPETIPIDDMTFFWENRDVSYHIRTMHGASKIETGGTTWNSQFINDSLVTKRDSILLPGQLYPSNPAIGLFSAEPGHPVDPGIHEWFPTNLKDLAVITLPEKPYKGTIICTVTDQNKNKLSATYSITNEYTPIYHASPNPSNTTLTLKKTASDNGLGVYEENKSIMLYLYNDYGIVCSRSVNTADEEIQIDVTNLPNGNYYLNTVADGEVIERELIFIKH